VFLGVGELAMLLLGQVVIGHRSYRWGNSFTLAVEQRQGRSRKYTQAITVTCTDNCWKSPVLQPPIHNLFLTTH